MSDHFKKKILHRAKYRGIKELDIIFDRFVKKYSRKLLDDEFYELDRILSLPDQLLLDIIFVSINNLLKNPFRNQTKTLVLLKIK